MPPAIRFDGVAKCYRQGAPSLRDSVAGVFRRQTGGGRDFWALRDLTFDVPHGQTLGIIGANGAGKSTILKLIAGIMRPTEGRVSVEGRVGTLIDLGAGFVPDLTGRENIYLCGALYGMAEEQIAARFDRIVTFSGLAGFLDVPVKYYSSGMYARLGFSIAIHIEAEIVLADDVLSVGDAAFQRQCVRRFEELKRSATILFVSHDLPRIRQVCDRVLWIKGGRLACDGAPGEVVDAYVRSLCREREAAVPAVEPVAEPGTRWGSGEIRITDVMTCDEKGQAKTVFRPHEALLIRLAYRVNGPVRDPGFCVNIMSDESVFLEGTNTFSLPQPIALREPEGMIELLYPRLPLLGGTFWLMVGATSGNNWAMPYDLWERCRAIEVLRTGVEAGLVGIEHAWNDQP